MQQDNAGILRRLALGSSLTLAVTAALAAAFTLPASAERESALVRLANGDVVRVALDTVGDTTSSATQLLQGTGTATVPTAPSTTTVPTAPSATSPSGALPTGPQTTPSTGTTTTPPAGTDTTGTTGTGTTGTGTTTTNPQADVEIDQPRVTRERNERRGAKKRERRIDPDRPRASRPKPRPASPLRNPDGTPTRSNPTYTEVLPTPPSARSVPNFIISRFRVPPFLLPIYQAAGIQYGVRWEILAAINEIETDYGRNLAVSSAGAVGWMQFLPSTWRVYGVDANKDGRKDPYNPVDAIFAAARYLKAAGYDQDVRRAIFAYNHADWYVDSVLLRARLIAGVPADLIGSLTGLTEGHFPVYARARYADDVAERQLVTRLRPGQNAARLVESRDDRRGIRIFARVGAPVVAVNDGIIKKIGYNRELGRYLVLQDVYGNRYLYAHLGSISRYYPVPKADPEATPRVAKAVSARSRRDPRPTGPASAGTQPTRDNPDPQPSGKTGDDALAPQPSLPLKQRLFAHPDHPLARDNGGLEQIAEMRARKDGRFETFRAYFSRPFGLDAKDVRLKRLRKGSRVIGGTILGRIGRTVPGLAAHVYFAIRPAGRGAPLIDPKPILDGWKLLEATAIYRASGRNVLYGDDGDGMSIGQVLLLPKPLLERRVLSDPRIDIYPCGREDIRSGQIDRRVLAVLAYLAENGLRPTVTSLKCGHSYYTSSGNVSYHSYGAAVDIAALNGIPITGHQERGGITEQAVRLLLKLQGTMRPDEIISLLDLGGPSFAMADHYDHIHVGFRPLFGENGKLGRQALAILKPGQWSDLIAQLKKIRNPEVPVRPSRYAIPARRAHRHRASGAHRGD